jgi:lambda family phage portal protein
MRSVEETKSYLAALEQSDVGARIAAAHGSGHHSAYRWGRLDRRTQGFQPFARSADAAIYESQELMHRRTRSESLNNAQIKKIEEALCDLIVGPGMLTFADPFDPLMDLTALTADDLDSALSYALEADELFEEWFCDANQFSVDGKLAGPDFQRIALAENVRVGDALILRLYRDEPGRIVPLCYQLIERDQLDWTHDRASGPNQNKIVNGIEVDRWGREVAFYIFDEHPHDDFSAATTYGKSTRVAAERVNHLCLFQRPSQTIGASWLHAIGQNNFDRDGMIGSELQTAKKAATLLLVAYLKNLKANLGLDDDGDGSDEYGNQVMKLGSSPIALKLGHDDKLDMIESKSTNPLLDPFVTILDHDTAGGVGLSYYTLTGRMDKSNYTAIRGALLAEDGHIRPLQNWFARRVALPMRREFQRQAIGLGKLKSVSASQFRQNERAYSRFDAVGAGRELLDPEAETNAALAKLRSGLTTLKMECARRRLALDQGAAAGGPRKPTRSIRWASCLTFPRARAARWTETTRAVGTNKQDTKQLLQQLGGAA